MKINTSKVFRSDNLYGILGIILLILVYKFYDGGRAKEGLMAESLAAIILPALKFTMGSLACRMKFYHARPHLFIKNGTQPAEYKPGYWKACALNVAIILGFMFAPL